jgi:response regulator of citrate/malate metabolism
MIRTLIVEDDARIADAHAHFVKRVPGFAVAGVAHSGREALRLADADDVDLILLDFYLPDMTGLDVCRTLRAHGRTVDIIAVTSAHDIEIVRASVAHGVVQYLLKPFTFAAFRDKLERYAGFRDRLATGGPIAAQQDVDRALATLRGAAGGPMPKGMSNETMEAVTAQVRTSTEGLTASEAGQLLGMARVTARRYLEFLVEQGVVSRAPRYGNTGRPEQVYRWNGA